MDYVVLDTETTGLRQDSDRIIEIGAVRIRNRSVTEERFHCYLRPDCPVHPEALLVHGLSDDFLQDKPRFEEVVDEFIAWISESTLVIHNAPFDVGFLNMELRRAGYAELQTHVREVIDTLPMARRLHRGKKNDLDSLLSRYNIDASDRHLHGALIDASLLARVFLRMTHRQQTINFDEHVAAVDTQFFVCVADLDRSMAEISVDWVSEA